MFKENFQLFHTKISDSNRVSADFLWVWNCLGPVSGENTVNKEHLKKNTT